MKKFIAIVAALSMGPAIVAISHAKDKKPAVEVRNIGEPINCVNIRQIQSTKIIDEKTIDFKMLGKKTYRNTMPHSCLTLKYEERFSYRTSSSQLCNVDIIRVLQNYGGGLQEGTSCGLGKFQQVEVVNPAN